MNGYHRAARAALEACIHAELDQLAQAKAELVLARRRYQKERPDIITGRYRCSVIMRLAREAIESAELRAMG